MYLLYANIPTHIKKYPFPLTKSRLNRVHGFVSGSLHSVLGERLFHIPDRYFWKFKFQAALSLQLVQMERSKDTLIGLWSLPSEISQLSGGHRGPSACPAESLNGHFCSHHTAQPQVPWSPGPWSPQGLLPFSYESA